MDTPEWPTSMPDGVWHVPDEEGAAEADAERFGMRSESIVAYVRKALSSDGYGWHAVRQCLDGGWVVAGQNYRGGVRPDGRVTPLTKDEAKVQAEDCVRRFWSVQLGALGRGMTQPLVATLAEGLS